MTFWRQWWDAFTGALPPHSPLDPLELHVVGVADITPADDGDGVEIYATAASGQPVLLHLTAAQTAALADCLPPADATTDLTVVLAALAPHAARTMARVRDTIAATDVECAELESAAERARDAFRDRPGPRRTDDRSAWQSPYGPPHRPCT